VLLRNFKRHPVFYFQNLSKAYGDLYTFWFGSEPVVFINNIEIAKNALNNNDCSDRIEKFVESKLDELFQDNVETFIFMAHNKKYKLLRKSSIEVLR
jgi:hypothetical protein